MTELDAFKSDLEHHASSIRNLLLPGSRGVQLWPEHSLLHWI